MPLWQVIVALVMIFAVAPFLLIVLVHMLMALFSLKRRR